jgi:exopolysaccharide production protein ExoY
MRISSIEARETRSNRLSDLLSSVVSFKRSGAKGTQSRIFDVAVALAVIAFAAPLLIAIAIAIRLQDGGPALYRQSRIGLNGRQFHCLKFRSMLVDSDAALAAHLEADPHARLEWAQTQKLRNDPRITTVGQFLRKSSLDEFPQFFNVLRGDMSIVGPRPIVAAEVSRYGRYFSHYSSVRPGVTGLWQVSGRSDVSYRRRVMMDVVYARSRSVLLDFKILLKTPVVVLLSRGSY